MPFEAVLDGEITMVDEEGQADFQLLQNYQKSAKGFLIYYVFDLLYFNGHDLTGLPLLRRKELLKKILPPAKNLKFSDHVAREGVLFFKVVKDKGLEGIVAKHAQSPYRVARRSREWLKIKTALTQEGVIAGFTEQGGARIFRQPGAGGLRRRRAGVHRPFGGRLRGRQPQGYPGKIAAPGPGRLPLQGKAPDQRPGHLGKASNWSAK